MIRAFAAVIASLLAYCNGRPAEVPFPAHYCVESVIVVAPGNDATCPWGSSGRVTPTSDGNVAFHCICPVVAAKLRRAQVTDHMQQIPKVPTEVPLTAHFIFDSGQPTRAQNGNEHGVMLGFHSVCPGK